jgi:GH24 family phage-related lysozyme (muramidase)
VPKNHLDVSDAGLKAIIGHEAEIDGLYNDSSGYCTFGIGHLAHDKTTCYLLEAADGDPSLKSLVQEKIFSKKHKLSFLPRGAVASDKYATLAAQALERAKADIARKLYKKDFAQLKADERQKVAAAATKAVNEEKRLLTLNVRDSFKEDLKPFIKSVNHNVHGVALNQDEFDALVSFVFNVGIGHFRKSSLLKAINDGKYRDGDSAKERKAAMDAIESDFLKWNKSGGAVVPGLTKRRQAEADLFLKRAKKEYEEKLKATRPTPQAPPRVAPKAPPVPLT